MPRKKKEIEPNQIQEKPKRPPRQGEGRPTIYCQEISDLICERVATNSVGIRKLCEMYPELPCVDTIYLWRYRHKEFSDQYALAKLKQADLLAEEIIDIADDGRNDWMESIPDEKQSEGWKVNGEHVNRSRLRIDTRKWLASKLLPKQYGGNEDKDKKDNDGSSLIEKLAAKLNK